MTRLRFNKQLLGVKDGGSVSYIPYDSMNGQIVAVIKRLQKMSTEELEDTVVCYRNTANSALLTDLLEEHGIPFNILSGFKPFTHELYRHVFHILDLLEQPYDRDLMINLYKVLPCSRTQIYEVFDFNPQLYKFKGSDPHIHFSKYNYGSLYNYRDFGQIIEILTDLSDRISTAPLSEIFPTIFSLLQKYFWKYKKQTNEDPIDDIFEKRAINFFNVPETYSVFYRKYAKRKGIVNQNIDIHAGVTVSTFHSLKGLEFKNVIVICMDNDIFPNFPLIDSHAYAPEYAMQLKEAETRLWYVAITRAKDNLFVYYNSGNPSQYVQDALQEKQYAKFDLACMKEISLEDASLTGKVELSSISAFATVTDEEFADEEFADEEFADEVVVESVESVASAEESVVENAEVAAEVADEPLTITSIKVDTENNTDCNKARFNIRNNDYLSNLLNIL